ncbi:putative toxin-antitoxin system antitoxin component [compost metagenome]
MNEGFDASYEELLKRVERMLGSRLSAEQWIYKPARGLDGARPVDMLASAEGVRLLDDFLGRLEYGVYT